MSKRLFLICLAVCFCFLTAMALAAPANAPISPDTGESPASSVPGYTVNDLEKLTDQIIKTGVAFNSIPALYKPEFLPVSDASLSMEDDEVVFILTYPNGRVRIYPQRILVWHEAVNDTLPDTFTGRAVMPGQAEAEGFSCTISYSPVTGSVVAFKSLAGRSASPFGIVGELINGNSLLFDWRTNSTWSQILGVAIDGSLRGRRLERVPVLWATWKGAKARYLGKAEVLSRSTKHNRPYGTDPYGSYQKKGTYYDDASLVYPVSFNDLRLPPKKRILGIEHEDKYGALQVDAVKKQIAVNFEMADAPMVALYDEELDTIRVFSRKIKDDGFDTGQTVSLVPVGVQFADRETKSLWDYEGNCFSGSHSGKKLEAIYAFDCMWFAWAAFHKSTQIYPPLPIKGAIDLE